MPEPSEPIAESPRRAGAGHRPSFDLAVGAFGVVELFAFGFWLFIGRHGWFYLDEWDFVATRKAGNVGDLFRPHNEHWVTLPILAYRLLYSMFGLREYMPYRVVGLLVYLAVPALLLVVMRRAGVHPWVATAAATAFALFGISWQNAVEPFQITFTASLVFGLVYLLLVDRDGPLDRRDGVGLLIGLCALMTSAVAVVMIVVVGITVLLRRGRRIAMFHVVPLSVCYLTWLLVVRSQITSPRNQPPTHVTIGSLLGFVGSGLRIAFGQFGPDGRISSVFELVAGVVTVAALILAVHQRRTRWRSDLIAPGALLFGAAVFLALTAVGRAMPTAPRVISVVAALMMPALALAADAVATRWRKLLPIASLALVVGIPQGARGAAVAQHSQNALVRLQREVLVTLPLDPLSRKVPPTLTPESNLAWRVNIGWLLAAAEEGRLKVAPVITPTERATDNFRLSLFVQRAPPPTAHCLTVHLGTTLDLRKGDVIGVSDNSLSFAPAVHPLQIQPHLVFVASHSTRVLVLRNLGLVKAVPLNAPSYPRICTTAPVVAVGALPSNNAP